MWSSWKMSRKMAQNILSRVCEHLDSMAILVFLIVAGDRPALQGPYEADNYQQDICGCLH